MSRTTHQKLTPSAAKLPKSAFLRAVVGASRRRLAAGETLTIAAIASDMRSTPISVARQFFNYTGRRLADYLRAKRIEYAAKLLREDPYQRVATVAAAAGFKSLSAFRDFFVVVFGELPGRYQRMWLRRLARRAAAR